MKTLRHYFISDDLDDLDMLEDQLEHAGIDRPRIHVLSNDSVGVANHIHLHAVQSIFTRDVVHCTCMGAVAGLLGVCLVLGVTYGLDLADATIGWTPYIFPVHRCDGFLHLGRRLRWYAKNKLSFQTI
jgi:hypothetical protein